MITDTVKQNKSSMIIYDKETKISPREEKREKKNGDKV